MDVDVDVVNCVVRVCGMFVVLGLVDVEDVVRDGKRGGVVDVVVCGVGDVMVILEEYEMMLVVVLDVLFEFLNVVVCVFVM